MKIFRTIAIAFCVTLLAAGGTVATSGQLLAYQDGFIFFTNGDGFRVAPNVAILDAKTHAPINVTPRPRLFARAVFDTTGTVTEIDLSKSALPSEPGDAAARFAVALSPPVGNPDLVQASSDRTSNGVVHTYSGKPVVITFTVEVPPSTPSNAAIYIMSDTGGWDAQEILMTRIDALHFSVTRRIDSGTIMHYLYDRGSLQSVELAESHLTREPRLLNVSDADVRAVKDTVYEWADTETGGQPTQANALPTPYNPSPFQNLPSGFPTPSAGKPGRPPG